ncbi:MAG: hypothetical protein GXY64_06570 [Bacteroidales bacterium]|nr:hypothetical protein [Bacteroidales bacterium]
MKKILSLILIITCATLTLTSCSDDGSKATCTYYVATTAVEHSDDQNKQYEELILSNIIQHGLSSYTFTESAESSDGRQQIAIMLCNEQAVKTFSSRTPTNMDLSTVQQEIFNANPQFFAEAGITSIEDFQLHPYTIHLTLLNEIDRQTPISEITIFVK